MTHHQWVRPRHDVELWFERRGERNRPGSRVLQRALGLLSTHPVGAVPPARNREHPTRLALQSHIAEALGAENRGYADLCASGRP